MKPILPAYDRVLVVAGPRYGDILSYLWDDRFLAVESRGYADRCSMSRHVSVSMALKFPT